MTIIHQIPAIWYSALIKLWAKTTANFNFNLFLLICSVHVYMYDITCVCVCVGVEVLSNLPLQMCLHFNAYYSIIWILSLIIGLKVKVSCEESLI